MTASAPLPPLPEPPPDRTPAGELAETFVLLDDSSGTGPCYLYENPAEILSARSVDEVPGALARLEAGIAEGCHAAGFFAYELGYALEPRLAGLMPEARNVPLLWFGLYRDAAVMTSRGVDGWLARHLRSGSYEFTDVRLAWDESAYLDRFAEVTEKIRAGDIYQLNLTFKAHFRLEGSPLTFYRDLRRRQRVAYGAVVDTGEATVLSASPELFLSRRGRLVTTRPMKGTAPRAGRPEADAELARALAADEKQRAENLMIVDLMRNDLGRIAETGGVSVPDLFTVETFRTLHQMTSGVQANLKPGVGMEALLRAIFPPGSVTGAPKIRAMELIRELESGPRGVYCGAIGVFRPSGDATFNVAIRTPVIFRGGEGEMGIGSGIVFDSGGAKEYAECLLKMKFLTDPPAPFDLIETLLYEPGRGYFLLERHIRRLAASARHFGFVWDEAQIRRALDGAVSGRDQERLRVRLLLSEDGAIEVTAAPQPPPEPGAVLRYAVSGTRVASTDPFRFHKTTRRELFDREWQEYQEREGASEVLYLNERGEFTEGSRTNLFVQRNGLLLTPALACGLLPGTLREELVASGRAVEAVLTPGDLEGAEAVFLGNSVRGLVRAVALGRGGREGPRGET